MTVATDHSDAVIERMRAAALPQRLIDEFVGYYRRFVSGDAGKVDWRSLAPPDVEDIVDLEQQIAGDERCAVRGRELLGRLVSVKLNGGLGTTMRLSGPKSLIPVRDGRCFLQIVVDQVEQLRRDFGVNAPLLLMNSFRTREQSLALLEGFSQPDGLPVDFVQHRVPRIDRRSGRPLADVDATLAEEDCWAPPGHADVYLALLLGGLLERLIAAGYRWAFVSNVDNLAATVDPALLGYLDLHGLDFAMEVTDKTAADIKGGTLVRHRGRLSLLERAQVDEAHLADFEDLDQLPVFNTNSLWWRLEAMHQRLVRGPLELPLIVNPKQVGSRQLVQLETAMGAAINGFDRALGVRVPRSRFAPVKDTSDLVAVRSDAYALDRARGLRLAPDRQADLGPPVIRLDPRFYGGLEDLERRCPHPLRLRGCRSLTVEGEFLFGRDVEITGAVVLTNPDQEPRCIPDGARLTGPW